MTSQPPVWASLRMVQLAARTLPPVHRLRYEGEFIAELYGMAPPNQLRYAARVLTHAWLLRGALNSAPATIGEEAMSLIPAVPLICRFNLRHKWQIISTEDGSNHYWACRVCGKDKPRWVLTSRRFPGVFW